MKKDEITYKVERKIAVLSAGENGYTKEINYVSWNGEKAKMDIRDWKPDGTPRKGQTFTEEEACALFEALSKIYGSKMA